MIQKKITFFLTTLGFFKGFFVKYRKQKNFKEGNLWQRMKQ